jgi:uncharacterized Zn finger protein
MARRGTRGTPAGWYPPPAAPRPVEGGLRARSRRGDIGETWWSHRFLALLESLGIGGRLDRGRAYARKGQVLSLEVEPGRVSAEVQGSRARPYRVRIGLRRLSEADWRRAEDAMVSRASFLAMLLAGGMPDDIEEAFAGGADGLFPSSGHELEPECSCPDWARPCKHVAAVYYLLAEAFDDDPFLILTWRGRPREQLLHNLRALRGSAPPAPTGPGDDDPWAAVEQAETRPIAARLDRFWDSGPELAVLALSPSVPHVSDAAVRELAQLDREAGGRPVGDLLRPAYDAFTVAARERLLADDTTC